MRWGRRSFLRPPGPARRPDRGLAVPKPAAFAKAGGSARSAALIPRPKRRRAAVCPPFTPCPRRFGLTGPSLFGGRPAAARVLFFSDLLQKCVRITCIFLKFAFVLIKNAKPKPLFSAKCCRIPVLRPFVTWAIMGSNHFRSGPSGPEEKRRAARRREKQNRRYEV